MSIENITGAIESLRQAKDDSGKAELAIELRDLAVESIAQSGNAHLSAVKAFKVIDSEALWAFIPLPGEDNGCHKAFKPFLKATFKAATADWDKAMRNMWAVSLVDLVLSTAEAGDVLGVDKSTVSRACKAADREAEGTTGTDAQRAAQPAKSPADKLEAQLKAFIAGLSDQGDWPTASIVAMVGTLDDAMDAARRQLVRREYKGPATSAGVNPRTGTVAPAPAPAPAPAQRTRKHA
jgi:hypothetical protein